MKTIINSSKNLIIEESIYKFKPFVLHNRTELFQSEEIRPEELLGILHQHFRERLNRSQNAIMIGEFAPYIFGDLLGISEANIKKAALPWLFLYEYSLLIDDLIDKNRPKWNLELLTSQVLLDISIRKFLEVVNYNQDFMNFLSKYRTETYGGILKEFSLSKYKYIQSSSETVVNQGRKSAFVKLLVYVLIKLEYSRAPTTIEEEQFDKICSAIQLLDDLTDFYEDYEESRTNLLLANTLNWLKIKGLNSDGIHIKKDTLFIAMLLSSSIQTSLELASNLLESSSQNIQLNGGIISHQYFVSINQKCLLSLSSMDNFFNSFIMEMQNYENLYLLDFTNNNLTKSKEEYAIESSLLSFCDTLPKACN